MTVPCEATGTGNGVSAFQELRGPVHTVLVGAESAVNIPGLLYAIFVELENLAFVDVTGPLYPEPPDQSV